MDVPTLFSTFDDPKLPKKCFQLFLESADSLQLFASENSDSMKSILQKLKNSLVQSKSCSTRPLLVLQLIVNQCNSTIFGDNCLQWLELLQKIITFNPDKEVLKLSCGITSDLLFYVAQNADLTREYSSSLLGSLVTSLLTHDQEIQVLKCLRQCLLQFRGPCRQLRKEIEPFLLGMFHSNNVAVKKEMATCLVLLRTLDQGRHSASSHKQEWEDLCNQILGSLYETVSKLLRRLEIEEIVWTIKDQPTLNLPALLLEETVPALLLQQLSSLYQTLCICLIEILSCPFPYPVNIPLGAILGFLCTILSLSSSDLVGTQKTIEDMMLVAVLPLLQTTALDVLEVLIEKCHRHLIPYSGMINRLMLHMLDSTSVQKNWIGSGKPYREIRRRLYEVIQLWATMLTSASGLERYAKTFLGHMISDSKNPAPVRTVANINPEPRGKKRKCRYDVSNTEVLNRKKANPLDNISLVKASLQAFRYTILAIGPLLSHESYMTASTELIESILKVQCNVLNKPPPYEDPTCRQHLYAALLTVVTSSSKETMPPLNTALSLFREGLRDEDHLVKGFCIEAMNTCSTLIHPIAVNVQSVIVPVEKAKDSDDVDMDCTSEKEFNSESKYSQTSVVDYSDIACSPIPELVIEQPKETKGLEPVHVLADSQTNDVSINLDTLSDNEVECVEDEEISIDEDSVQSCRSDNEETALTETIPLEETITQAELESTKQDEGTQEITEMLESFVNAGPDEKENDET